jgi:hypothetical protein
MADASDKPSRPRLGKVLGAASRSPVNLGVAGAAAVAAAAVGSWPLLALGGAAYAALVAWDSANPSFWKKVLTRADAPPKMPDPKTVQDPGAREAILGIARAKRDLEAVLADTPAEVRAHVSAALVQVGELEGRAARLALRAQDLHRYLERTDAQAVRQEAERLAERAQAANDGQAKAQFSEARKARLEQLRTLADIEAARERLHANLQRIVSTLEGLPPKLVRMRALDDQAMDSMSGDMNAELDHMNAELRTFEETLKTLVEVSAS